jgi:hypothetical protein
LQKTKATLLIFIATHASVATPRDFCQMPFSWQLPYHKVILCLATTHTHTQYKKTTHKIQCYQTPPHIHLVIFLVSKPLKAKTPSHQQKKQAPIETLKPLFVHTQNPKVRNLLQFHHLKTN